MSSITQTTEDFGLKVVARSDNQALAIVARIVLGIALLPVALVVACWVAREVGRPLTAWTRLDNGPTYPSPRVVRFRTTRIETETESHRRIVRSKIGNFICRSGLDKLPNIYFGSLDV